LTSVEVRDPRPPASPRAWLLLETARMGCREYLAMNPPGVVAAAVAPRFLLQVLFFTVLGGVIAGAGHRQYAFVGGLALAVCTTNILYVSQVPVADKESATFWRIRTGPLHPATVFVSRALPYPLVGFGLLVASGALVASVAGLMSLAVDLLPLLWVYLVMSFTATAAGLAAAGFAIGKRVEVLASNLLAYLVMLCSGAFLPPGRLAVVDVVGSVLPARHGLAAIHAARAGRPWLWQVAAEAAVGVAWLGLSVLIVAIQVRRARRHGHDDFE
jgi:ABC-2 family transporter